MSICLPSSCESFEIEKILQKIMPFNISIPAKLCSKKEPAQLDSGDILAMYKF